jgi:TetR/AcrR family transcriptional regulator, cholesterol catabolism regulator
MPRLSKARKAMLDSMMKETIFEAATSVLCQHGVVGTTMNRVAEAANLAKSSLYDYFDSKEELLHFFSSRIVEPCCQAYETIAKMDISAPQKLEQILRTAWEHAVKHKCLIRLIDGAGQGDEVRKNIRPRLLQLFAGIFAQGIEEGAFRPCNPAPMGRIFLGCLAEVYRLQAEDAPSEEVNEYVSVLIDAVLNGFSVNTKRD